QESCGGARVRYNQPWHHAGFLHDHHGRHQVSRLMRQPMIEDLRFGIRMLWRSPGFSILAILCLTLGIGANAAVFSWIEGILLRPFPAVTHQDRMMAIAGTVQGIAGEAGNSVDLSWPDFVDLQRNTTLFDWFIM